MTRPCPCRALAVAAVVAAGVATVALAIDAAVGGEAALPVRGFCIAAPHPDGVVDFVDFIRHRLQPAGVNTLVLRVDYGFQFRSHPELSDNDALSRRDAKRIRRACRRAGIRLVPQVNLLGHQSWESKLGKLLEVHPELDETPWVAMPERYEWPNLDGLYCKSYCPLHPDVHRIVFALIDEVVDAFEADAFHAGMDEVFYIAEDRCPRCAGRDPAELFAGEVTQVRDHLAGRGVELWIWGDRLLDGRTTGLGMWEASMNNTHRAIDLIPRDVVICDWHYERPDPTAVLFAMKGFRVMTCSWNRADVTVDQIRSMRRLRRSSTPEMRERFLGVMQTVWSANADFLDQLAGRTPPPDIEGGDPIECTRAFLEEVSSP
jgi:hypothetical protein